MEESVSLRNTYCSLYKIITLLPNNIGLFRFLLEGYDNLAGFTVIDKEKGLIKVFFSPDQTEEVEQALCAISTIVPLEINS